VYSVAFFARSSSKSPRLPCSEPVTKLDRMASSHSDLDESCARKGFSISLASVLSVSRLLTAGGRVEVALAGFEAVVDEVSEDYGCRGDGEFLYDEER